jgi:hypothetical protein
MRRAPALSAGRSSDSQWAQSEGVEYSFFPGVKDVQQRFPDPALGPTLGDLLTTPLAHGGLSFGRTNSPLVIAIFIFGCILFTSQRAFDHGEEADPRSRTKGGHPCSTWLPQSCCLGHPRAPNLIVAGHARDVGPGSPGPPAAP